MTLEELKQKVNDAILNLGITPAFTENPSFHRIIENTFYPLLEKIESGKKINPKIITNENAFVIKDDYTVFSLDNDINKTISFRLNKEKESSFGCIAEVLKGIPESAARQLKEVIKINVKIDYDGNIYTNEVYSYAKETSRDNMLEGSAICVNTIYDSNGIMVKKERKNYNGLGYNTNISHISNNELLYIPNKAFDIQSNISIQYDRRETMIREAFDIAEIHVNEQATCKDYIGYTLLDNSNSLANMEPITSLKLSEWIEIEPLTEEEIKEKISQESDPQIRHGLLKYAQNRNQYKYYNGKKEEVLINTRKHK